MNSTGRLIAVGYEARSAGVKRHMTGKEASEQCTDLILFQVPSKRGKADLSRWVLYLIIKPFSYRNAGAEVIKAISKYTTKIERASVDEAYVDVTGSKRLHLLKTL